MRKNTLVGAVGGGVVTLALCGIGYLLLGGDNRPQPAPVRSGSTPSRSPAAARAEGVAPVRLPRAGEPLRLPATRLARLGGPPEVKLGDRPIERQLQDLLAEYEEIMRTDPSVPLALNERRRRLDEIVRKLAALGPEGVPLLHQVLKNDARGNNTPRQMILVRALALIPGAGATGVLKDVLAGAQWGVQMAVVAQLATRGAEGIAVLKERLEAEPDYRVRGAMLKQISQSDEADAVEITARMAKNDPNANVQRAAVRALATSHDPEAVRTLEDLARGSQDMSVRQASIQAFARAAGPDAVVLLDELILGDPNIRVKSVAILGLQVVATPEAVTILERTASDPTQTADVQARARGALAAIDRRRRGGTAVERGGLRGSLQPLGGKGLQPLKPIGGGR